MTQEWPGRVDEIEISEWRPTFPSGRSLSDMSPTAPRQAQRRSDRPAPIIFPVPDGGQQRGNGSFRLASPGSVGGWTD
jgi:hypothetical protein